MKRHERWGSLPLSPNFIVNDELKTYRIELEIQFPDRSGSDIIYLFADMVKELCVAISNAENVGYIPQEEYEVG